jgi:glycosyltransferase involved in cell wall biosynthesis
VGPNLRIEPFDLRTYATRIDRVPKQRAEEERYRDLFDQDWDVRFIYLTQTWALNTVWDLIGQGNSADILAPCGYSLLPDPSAADYFRLIERLLPRFASVVYHSPDYQDYWFADQRGLLENAVVIPNATDLPQSVPAEVKHAHGVPVTACTAGSHVRSKGHSAFVALCERAGLPGTLIAPRPASTRERVRGCYYTCRVLTGVSRKVDLVEGSRREAFDAAMGDAHLFVFPSKVETAPLVILEAMARNLPWVSYDAGMVKKLPGGIVVQGFSEAVDAVNLLAKDPDRRVKLARSGRAAIETSFTWDRILPMYERLIETVSRPAPQGAD